MDWLRRHILDEADLKFEGRITRHRKKIEKLLPYGSSVVVLLVGPPSDDGPREVQIFQDDGLYVEDYVGGVQDAVAMDPRPDDEDDEYDEEDEDEPDDNEAYAPSLFQVKPRLPTLVPPEGGFSPGLRRDPACYCCPSVLE